MSTPGGRPEPPSGLLVVDKPAGLTSHDVVARVRRLAGTRKVGHAGTLDPMATGVLVLGVGRGTRLLGHLSLASKSYEATIRLGAATTTDDAEGDVLERADPASLARLDDDAVREALGHQVGELDQVPSSVSAVKVDGRRAHARVRAGEDVVLAPRRVSVHSLEVLDVRELGDAVDVDVSVACSSGTYVRAIARDVGRALGVGGHLVALRRTRVGPFDLVGAATLDELADHFEMSRLGDAARVAFGVRTLEPDVARLARHGRTLEGLGLEGLTALLDGDGELLALYEPREGLARPVAVLV